MDWIEMYVIKCAQFGVLFWQLGVLIVAQINESCGVVCECECACESVFGGWENTHKQRARTMHTDRDLKGRGYCSIVD